MRQSAGQPSTLASLMLVSILLLAVAGCGSQGARQAEQVYPGAISQAKAVQQPICVYLVRPRMPDRDNAVDVDFIWTNISTKTISEVLLTLTPYTAVNDPVLCTKTQQGTINLRVNGPFAPGFPKPGRYERIWIGASTWPGVWTQSLIDHVRVDRVFIGYTDGSNTMILGEDLLIADENTSWRVAED